MLSTRTDLAVEAFEDSDSCSVPGVHVSHWDASGVEVTEVLITDNEAAHQLGKPKGSYLTLECPLLRKRDCDARLAMAALLSEELSRILPEGDERTPVMVVGLGNRSITPDALGPSVVDRTLVTRHILSAPYSGAGLRSVCAIAPGVLGVTGLESHEVIEALVQAVSPRAVLCVDSLAARSSRRIGCTIQVTNTGIQPGAGVGNHRKALTRDSLGVPVISLGMPTVVYAATLARDAFAWLSLQGEDGPDEHRQALEEMEQALLSADIGEMIVSPREIDAIIEDAAGIIASAVNRALQPALSDAEIAAMMN